MSTRRSARGALAAAALALAAPGTSLAQDVSLEGCACLQLSIAEPWRSGPAASDSVERPASALFSRVDSLPQAPSGGAGTWMRRVPHLPPASILLVAVTTLAGAAVLAHRRLAAAPAAADS